MKKRNKKLIEEITPILKKLNKGWFPPDKKTPDGNHYYSCSYCDMECGGHKNHDPDCYYQCAKNVIDEWQKIKDSTLFDISPISKNKRSKKDINEFKEFFKVQAVVNLLFAPILKRVVPFDYADEDDNVVCQCRSFGDIRKRFHSKDCVDQQLAKVLSNYYNPRSK